MKREWSKMVGVEMKVTAWQDDGMVTIYIPEIAKPMAASL